jgi:serine/threonine protein kinase
MSSTYLLRCRKCGVYADDTAYMCSQCWQNSLLHIPVVLPPGTLLDSRYEILDLMTTGGMAQIYRAHFRRLSKVIILKRLLPDPTMTPMEQAQYTQQFQNEAKILANLKHKALPEVTDQFESFGTEFHVMTFIEGQALEQVHPSGITPDVARRLLLAALDVLEYVHSQQILHLDIKPDNLLLTRDERLFLVDFGLATNQGANFLRQSGIVYGHTLYSSPEQIEGDAVSPASDIYSLGMTFAKLLATNNNQTVPNYEQRRSNSLFRLDFPQLFNSALENTLSRATAWLPHQRFQSAGEMRDSLRQAFGATTGNLRLTRQTGTPADDAYLKDQVNMLLRSPLAPERQRAAKLLGLLKDGRGLPPLLLALSDADVSVRWQVIKALGEIGDSRATRPLIAVLHSTETDLRWVAAKALGGIRDGRAVEPLIEALKDKSLMVRSYAAEALGEIGDRRALPALELVKIYPFEDANVKRAAGYAITKIQRKTP